MIFLSEGQRSSLLKRLRELGFHPTQWLSFSWEDRIRMARSVGEDLEVWKARIQFREILAYKKVDPRNRNWWETEEYDQAV